MEKEIYSRGIYNNSKKVINPYIQHYEEPHKPYKEEIGVEHKEFMH